MGVIFDNYKILEPTSDFEKEDLRLFLLKSFGADVINISNLSADGILLNIDISFALSLKDSTCAAYHQLWPLLANEFDLNPLKKYLSRVIQEVEVNEFSLQFSDCRLTINKIYPKSIINDLGIILSAILSNGAKMGNAIKGKKIDEIHIPIIEATDLNSLPNQVSLACWQDYLKYWGIYFEDDNEQYLYDVFHQSILKNAEIALIY